MEDSNSGLPLQPFIDAVAPKSTRGDKGDEPPKLPPPPAKTPPSPNGNNKREHCRPDQTPLWKMVLETAAVFVGVYVATIYKGQLNVMQGQLGEIIEQYPELQKSAQAAKDAASTASQTLTTTQQQFRLDERPYMYTIPHAGNSGNVVIFSPKKDGLYVVDYAVDFKNSGRSPAVHAISTTSEAVIGPHDEATRTAMAYTPAYSPSSWGSIVAVGDSITIITESCKNAIARYQRSNRTPRFKCLPEYVEPVLTQEQVNHLLDETWDVYILGSVKYTDIFEPPIASQYETTFCYHINPKGLPYANCNFVVKMK